MSDARVKLGRAGEDLAADQLRRRGYAIVARNYRCAGGEIDLVARHGAAWVFVEVRTRRGTAFGTPEESVTPRKRRHLLTAAKTYLTENALADVDWRIDFVGVEFTDRGELARVEVIENAVRA
jgi:putative endonuclease